MKGSENITIWRINIINHISADVRAKHNQLYSRYVSLSFMWLKDVRILDYVSVKLFLSDVIFKKVGYYDSCL